MEHFLFMKECLKKFHYPLIDTMDDATIADIFGTPNRRFLVSWILKNIDDDFVPVIEQATEEELVDIIDCTGLCDGGITEEFMCGECDTTVQLAILYRMFRHMQNVTGSSDIEEVQPLSLDSLENFIKFDTNLCPKSGPKKTLTPEERASKIEEFNQEIIEIGDKLTQEKKAVDPELKDKLTISIQQLQEQYQNFQTNFLDLSKTKKYKMPEYSPDFSDKLKGCADNTEVLLKLIQSMRIIRNFEEDAALESENEENEQIHHMNRELSDICDELVALKKEK